MIADDDQSHRPPDLRSFGRKRGRKLSPRQQRLLQDVLPRVRPDAAMLAEASRSEERPVWLEIGFGGGEHLLWQAEAHPGVLLVGCEPYEEGVVKVLTAIEDRGLENVRVLADDVRPLLRALPASSLTRAFILFPDPWPKKRHVKRRLVSAETLGLLARVLKPGAELRVATDIGDYARTILLAITDCPDFLWPARSPEDWRRRGADWPPTRYEAKAGREGRRCAYFTFLRR
ncbi:MAG: tRNA (guanine(46)-N(7))-methyltransferase TrmB [Hyphomicrobium sp.]